MYQPKTISTDMLVPDGPYPVFGANGIIGRYDQYNHSEPELLMTCRGATCGTINVSLPYSWINGNAMVIHPVNDDVLLDYLKYHLMAIDLSKVITGAAQPQITRQSLIDVSVMVPPVEEQKRIVEELDLLTDIIDKKNAQLRDLDTLAQSIFYEMFGNLDDQVIINNQLGDVCSIVGRIGFRGYTRYDFVDGPEQGAISLSPANIVNGEMDYQKCSYVTWEKYEESPEIMINNEDILVVKTGSSYGKTALVRHLPHKATINPQFVVLKDVTIDKNYLTAYLSTPFAKRKYEEFVIGTAIPTFSQKKLASMPLLIPPLEKQHLFSEKIRLIIEQKEAIRHSAATTTILLNSRMDYYFNE